MGLHGKVILVTGGYGYLGQAICKGLLAAGAEVFVLGRSHEKFSEAFTLQDNLNFEYFDITSTRSIKKGFETIFAKTRKIDVLVNNAIYSKGQDPENMLDEDWVLGVDGVLNSTYRCIREVIPYMKKQSRGKIINVSSMYGVVSPDFRLYEGNDFLNPPHYGAAKAGVIQLTRYFACYLGKNNIQVNVVTPGAFPSKQVKKNTTFTNALRAKIPLNRVGTPSDLQGAFILLSSEASNFITGQNFIIDGGWTAW